MVAIKKGLGKEIQDRVPNGVPSFALNTDKSVAGLSVAGALMFPAYLNTNVCIVGDSIAQQNSNIVTGSYNTLQRGPVPNMLSKLGHPWEFQPDDNYAVFGTTLDIILTGQIPTMLAAHKTRKYSRCFLSCGTAFTLQQIKDNFTSLFEVLRANGIIPVHTGIRPRGVDIATTNAKQQNAHLNEWLYLQSLAGLIEFIDCTHIYADNSTAFGNVLTTMVYDAATSKLHPNGLGATLEGWAMADYYTARGVSPQIKFATMQNDVFDRTYNPSGVAFASANPLLQGNTGTLGGVATGVAPTGMQVGATGSAAAYSKVNRTLSNGQVRSDVSCVLASSTLHFLYDDWANVTGNWGATQLQTGDILEARAKIVMTSGVNIQNIRIMASIKDGVTAIVHSGLFTDTSAMPDGTYTLYLKTPRFTVPAYAGTGNVNIFSRVECTTAAAASGTWVIQALEVRKVG